MHILQHFKLNINIIVIGIITINCSKIFLILEEILLLFKYLLYYAQNVQ